MSKEDFIANFIIMGFSVLFFFGIVYLAQGIFLNILAIICYFGGV